MKHLISTTILLFISLAGIGQVLQKKDVPPAVLKSYISQNSSGVLDSSWSRQTLSIYKVNYIEEGKRLEAQYFEDGSWIKTFNEVSLNDLPPSIVNQVRTVYAGRKINKVCIELNPEGRFYAVDIGEGADKLTLYYHMNGKFVK